MIKSFVMQLKFLTRLPFFNVEFDGKKFAEGIIFSPIIGLLIGGILVLVFLLTSIFENIPVCAVAIVFAGIVITGGLHVDGLADTCDGLFSGREREKILDIMRDSRIGTNGTVAIFLLLAFKVILISAILQEMPDKFALIPYMLVIPAIARNNIIITSGISDYARDTDGMGKSIVDNTGIKQIIIGTVITMAISIPIVQFKFIALFAVPVIFALIFTSYVKFKIGGITGDVIGATIEISEVLVLLTAFIMESSIFKGILSKII
jgi:adenosylcobinamide-GDP ribazoletransferase